MRALCQVVFRNIVLWHVPPLEEVESGRKAPVCMRVLAHVQPRVKAWYLLGKMALTRAVPAPLPYGNVASLSGYGRCCRDRLSRSIDRLAHDTD